jgi:hypothetical protein
MDEAETQATSGTLIRALATTLGKLRRSPGKDEGWVESVLRVLERDQPERYDRIRRRLGFAQRLSDLGQLRVEEEALASLALFWHELMGERPPQGPPTGPWVDYLFRNEYWLGPCLQVCEAVYAESWDQIDNRPSLIARFVVEYDGRTLIDHQRPLQVIQSMVGEAEAAAVDQIGSLIWSEEGQELCDFHFRRHADYTLDAKHVRRSLELLKRVLPAPAVGTTRAGPVMVMPAQAERASPRRASASEQASANFERRRQALRSTKSSEPEPAPEPQASQEETPPSQNGATEAALPPPAPLPPPPIDEAPEPVPLRPRREPKRLEQEDVMNRTDTAPARVDGDGVNITRRIETVRSQLDQIRRIAADTQELLADLAPQVEELADWVAEMESVVSRFRTRGRSEQRVA